ncbi:MAG TPA: HAMP domain-containing sensor histidine kinase [Clostridia bacterium]|nr:HAMP domain-containing sensor histidine kinase [Clostridia bacterium]
MKVGGITKRWIRNTLGIISVILIITAVSSIVFMHNYYYRSVRFTLLSKDNDLVDTYFDLNTGSDSAFVYGARGFVETFNDKDTMEVWVIDKNGNVVVTSSGFDVDRNIGMPDYDLALTSDIGRGEWLGKLDNGEKVMTMTVSLTSQNNKTNGAIRYMVSLEDIDAQIIRISVVICLFSLLSIVLVIISGIYFIQSIVKPIQKISETAKQIAGGDFEARIESFTADDEIGELSDTINFMASEISAADKMKNDFLSTVSHELRTPLTAIKGWGETILQVGDGDQALTKRGMEVIISEASRLSGIVEELLDFSRIQSGRIKLKLEKIDVLAELDETVFTFKERALKEGIELIYNAPDLPAPMSGDAARIKQVFVNILDNSFKYNNQGGKVVVFSEVDLLDSLEIVIGDTGCGIAPEDLPRVKEKFFKSNTSVRGSGIGLAVSDEIVKLHGGEISVDSVLGEGTSVTIKLPLEINTASDERGKLDE